MCGWPCRPGPDRGCRFLFGLLVRGARGWRRLGGARRRMRPRGEMLLEQKLAQPERAEVPQVIARNAEPLLLAVEHTGRHGIAIGEPQQPLQAAVEAHGLRQAEAELDDAPIEQRDPRLERYSHARAVHL